MNVQFRTLVSAVASCLVGSSLCAQANTPLQDSKVDEEVVELTPFVVTTSNDEGYFAANTLAGSRLNTSLIDTPASISEITAELIADLNANTVNDIVDFSLGFQRDTPGGNDNLSQYNSHTTVARGLGRGSTASRDYFPWDIADDTFSIERLSQSRGPNSVLFGIGNAGGIINTTTKRAQFRDRNTVGLKFDEHGGWRATLDFNKKLSDKLAVRLNAVKDDIRTWRDLEYTRDDGVQLATTWRPFKKTEVRAEYERRIQDRLTARRFSAVDRVTPWITAGKPVYDRTINGNTYPTGVIRISTLPRLTYDGSAFFNVQNYATGANPPGIERAMLDETYVPFDAFIAGPTQTSDNDMHTASLIIQQEVIKNLFVELGYNRNGTNREVKSPVNWSDQALRIDPNVTVPAGATVHTNQLYVESNPRYDQIWRDDENLRFLATYEWDTNNKWLGSHRFVFLATQRESDAGSDSFQETNLTPLRTTVPALNNGQNLIWRRAYLSQNGVFGDNGVRYYNQDPYAGVDFSQGPLIATGSALAFSDPVNSLNGTITPGWFKSDGNLQWLENRSAMLAGQSRLLKNRLIVTWGVRKDRLDQRLRVVTRNVPAAYVTDVSLGDLQEFSGETKTIGGVVPVTSWFSLYANKADNFSPQGSSQDITQQSIGNVIGEGHDYGFKVNLSGNRLYLRVGEYQSATTKTAILMFNETTYIRRIWEAIEGPTGSHYLEIDQTNNGFDTIDTEAKGREFELVANPVKGLSLTFNYATLRVQAANVAPIYQSYIAQYESTWAAADQNLPVPSVVGQTLASSREALSGAMTQRLLQNGNEQVNNYRYSLNFVGRYQFQGEFLKGWTVGGGYRYRDGRIVNYTTAGEKIWAPSYGLANAFVTYHRKIWDGKIDMTARLNVSNLFDNRDLIWAQTDVTGAIVTRYTFQDPRLTTLSFDFSF